MLIDREGIMMVKTKEETEQKPQSTRLRPVYPGDWALVNHLHNCVPPVKWQAGDKPADKRK